MESSTGHIGRVEAGGRSGPASAPLKIAMVMPPWYEIPPDGYGGLERVSASLVEGLITRGHEVTLFGTGKRTGTRARFVSTNPEPQYPRLLEAMPELIHVTRVNELLQEKRFDIIHDHSTIGPLTAAGREAPTVVTVHSSPGGEVGEYLSRIDPSVGLISISHAQRRMAPELNWVSTIHHGIEVPAPAKTAPSDGPVLWLGRFAADKGPDLAIAACRKAGLPLVLAGKANQRGEWKYLEEVIRPMLANSSDVEIVLNGDRSTTDALLSGACCLVLPIRWEEPFGMVMIEAMSQGTPVVALRHGAVPEVVAHGCTGFVCDDETELPDALHLAAKLSPTDCVLHIQQRFSVELMAHRHERFYRRFIMEHRRRVVARSQSQANAARPLIAGVPAAVSAGLTDVPAVAPTTPAPATATPTTPATPLNVPARSAAVAPGNGAPAKAARVSGTPANPARAGGAPANPARVNGAPANPARAGGAPANPARVNGAPANPAALNAANVAAREGRTPSRPAG